MQLGMIGLGRMGSNLVRRLMLDGHECVVYDLNPATVQALQGEGAAGASSLDDFVERLSPPRVAWMMVPAAFVGDMVEKLTATTSSGPRSSARRESTTSTWGRVVASSASNGASA